MKLNVAAILFDIDDTLVDHSTAIHSATLKLHQRVAPHLHLEEFQAKWRTAHTENYPRFLRGDASYVDTARARVRQAIDPVMTDVEADDFFATYLADYERGWSVFADVMPCLDRLAGFRLGVISNGRAVEQRKKLEVLNLYERFEYVCVSEDIGVAKPAAEIFQHACERLRLSPMTVLYVGDHYAIDVCGARAAGLQTVWLNRRQELTATEDVPSIISLDEL